MCVVIHTLPGPMEPVQQTPAAARPIIYVHYKDSEKSPAEATAAGPKFLTEQESGHVDE